MPGRDEKRINPGLQNLPYSKDHGKIAKRGVLKASNSWCVPHFDSASGKTAQRDYIAYIPMVMDRIAF